MMQGMSGGMGGPPNAEMMMQMQQMQAAMGQSNGQNQQL